MGTALAATFMIATLLLIVVCAGLTYFLYVHRRRVVEMAHQLSEVEGQAQIAVSRLQNTASASHGTSEQLARLGDENRRLLAELDKRPRLDRKEYRIVTLGIGGTGKTSLSLKWANPLVHLDNLRGTKFEKYERTVSLTHNKEAHTAVEHVFEVNDWGGEHLHDAQAQLVREDTIHGMLFVVDLGYEGSTEVDLGRVQLQLKEFEANALRFMFSPAITKHCKTVVLFINKSDLIPGTPAEVEQKAREYYAPLIEALNGYHEAGKVELLTLVGSAEYGHNVHHLFAHFVASILPENAYDDQLLQRLRTDGETPTTASPLVAPPVVRTISTPRMSVGKF